MEPSTSEEDDIVMEIPICHSTRLQDCLYSFRYPLLSKNCLNELSIRKGFYKPHNQEMQLDMEINVESANFDSDRAQLMAQEVDGAPEDRKPNANIFFENDLVDKVCLKSTKVVKEPSKYAAMVYNGKEIHLTTLKGIFEFRPTFPHIEKSAKKRGKDTDHNDVSDDDEPGPSSAQPITVKFKQNDDRWKKAKLDSFRTLAARSAEEPWIKCDYYTENSTISKVEKLKLMTDNTESTKQATNLSDSEYLRVLIPEDQEQAIIEPSLPSHIMSLHALRALPIQEQCKLLLKDAQIVQFQQLSMILAGGEGLTADTLLKNLPKVANLVRGNWVVKSDVLYPEKTFSATSGVPAEHMCRARDYVLYLFTKNQYVERKKVSSMMKIPSEEVKEIFTGFSKLSHNKGWELVLPFDHDFTTKHTEIVQKQMDAWEQRFKQVSQFLKENQRQRRKSKSISDDRKGGPYSASSDNESGAENKKKSPIAARRSFKERDSGKEMSEEGNI